MGDPSGFYRLYMAPGMLHCGVGPGPNTFGNLLDPAPTGTPDRDLFAALTAWVEKGRAPEVVVATKYVDDDPAKGRDRASRICPWPLVARTDGKGDPDTWSYRCTKDD
jgi:feruloyl esterase